MTSTENSPARAAPPFSLPDADEKTRTLTEFLAQGPVVVVFYPADFTPTCTKQLCSYRDAADEYAGLGIQIVGISADSPEKHRKFREKYGFKFPLLTDAGKKVAREYGATSKWLLGAVTRANFIVSREGTIVAEHIDGIPVTHQTSTDLSGELRRLRAENKI